MNTSSVAIKKIHAFLRWLNFYFEYCLIFRGLCAIKNAAKGSRILGEILDTDFRDYWQGSLILRFFSWIIGGVLMQKARFIQMLARVNESSLNKKIFVFFANLGVAKDAGFLAKTVGTCAHVRIVRLLNLKILYMIFLLGALMVPGHLWSNMNLALSAVFFAACCTVKWCLSAKEKPNFSIVSPALLLFVFFCALSIFTGYGGTDSVRVFVIFFSCVVHSVLVSLMFNKKEDLRLFFYFMAFALACVALFGMYRFAMGIEIRAELVDLGASPGLSRLTSTMGNPNTDAQAWAMLLPFLIAVCITTKCDAKRILLAAAVALVVVAFALTYSRAGYVAFLAGLAVFILMIAPRLVPVAALALIIALPFIPAGVLDRLFTLGQDTSSQYRFWIWEGVMRMLDDFWIRGVGMGPAAFIRIYQAYAHPAAERAMHSHNMFLDILAHSGIGAFLAFLAYLFRLFKRGIATFSASADREQKIYLAAGIASLTVFVVFGVGEYVWFEPRVMLVFWISAGILGGFTPEPPRTFLKKSSTKNFNI
jgi:O-antigen ligase